MTADKGEEQRNEMLCERYAYLFEEELIEDIIRVGEWRSIRAESELMHVGQTITHMPLILSGSLKVMTEDDQGEELLLYYLEQGDSCAMTMQCTVGSAKSNITVLAEEQTEMVFIPVEYIEHWMKSYSSWRRFVLDTYNTRLQEMLEAIDNLAFHNMEERLLKYLRDKAMVLGNGELKITHHQIANDLHSSRVVISRLMKKLEKAGIIKQHRNRVDVLEFQG